MTTPYGFCYGCDREVDLKSILVDNEPSLICTTCECNFVEYTGERATSTPSIATPVTTTTTPATTSTANTDSMMHDNTNDVDTDAEDDMVDDDNNHNDHDDDDDDDEEDDTDYTDEEDTPNVPQIPIIGPLMGGLLGTGRPGARTRGGARGGARNVLENIANLLSTSINELTQYIEEYEGDNGVSSNALESIEKFTISKAMIKCLQNENLETYISDNEKWPAFLKTVAETKVDDEECNNSTQADAQTQTQESGSTLPDCIVDSCPVCFEQYKLDQCAARLTCRHHFHLECLETWLKKHNTCPICRDTIEQVKKAPFIPPTTIIAHDLNEGYVYNQPISRTETQPPVEEEEEVVLPAPITRPVVGRPVQIRLNLASGVSNTNNAANTNATTTTTAATE